jgi:hypothetical protein
MIENQKPPHNKRNIVIWETWDYDDYFELQMSILKLMNKMIIKNFYTANKLTEK